MGGVESRPLPVIAAIDFGTTFTGYLFCFRDEPDRTYGPEEHKRKREPTCVLLDENKAFVHFGKQATEFYFNNLDDDERSNYYFFRKFKISAFEEGEDKLPVLKDEDGTPVDAMHLFKVVYTHFKADILKGVNECKVSKGRHSPFTEDDILWVITIPAVWGFSRRQFVKKAFEKANLKVDNIKLVLEPEAASIEIRKSKMVLQNERLQTFKAGQKYLLADLGGGTVDICAHQVTEDGNLVELFNSSGGVFGGILVNQAFEEFLKDIFGEDVLESYKTEYPGNFYDLQMKFEEKKMDISFDKKDLTVVFKIDIELISKFQKTGKNIVNEIEAKYKDIAEWKNPNKLFLKGPLMKRFFERAVTDICGHIDEVLQCNPEKNIDILLLSGGFAESKYIQGRIRERFNEKQVVVVPDPKYAVMQGALKIGACSAGIIERKSPFTYGFYAVEPFEHGRDPEDMRILREGEEKCDGKFHKLVAKGDPLKCGQIFKRDATTSYTTDRERNRPRYTSLWRSEKTNPRYCKLAFGCHEIAKITIVPPIHGWPGVLRHRQQLIVQENEFQIKFINTDTNEEQEMHISYLD
ncbi:heat shock 70 kDa protein 12A-like [Mya arenaria]|uniref:heat shock 70 kDa protein 12A-like n=1 Tax=Mya arenaria TaxID=6604 RepID=UPI0022E72FE8|nr:heat shock 70 kDa protein 12A-like [Mya arenaria]